MDKIFEGMPKSFWATTLIFMYLFFYLFYIHLRGTALNTFEFYSISLIPILTIVGVRGAKFWDDLGFNIDHASWGTVGVRLIILVLIGFLIGYGMYKIDQANFSLLGYHLLPMDTFFLQLSTYSQAFQTFVDVFVIAFFEEIIRAVGFMGYANWFRSKGFRETDSVIYGVVLASVMFILLHYFSWGGLDLISIMIGVSTVSIMSLSGYVLKDSKIFGKISFYQWAIYSPLIAHMTFDYLSFMHLSIAPGIIPQVLSIL